jgi:serine/threonine-protein kinase
MTQPRVLRVPGAEDLPRIPGLEIERELGRGGMGVVHLTWERNPDRAVAVKFLPRGPFTAPADRDRWLKEARAAGRVRHPHIVQLHRVNEADDWLYLVLEYVSGDKTACKSQDSAAIRRCLSMSVEAARQAVAADPDDQEARFVLNTLQRRLDKYPKGRP